MQWRKLKILFMGLALLLGISGGLSVHAAGQHMQNVTIVKYGLSPGATGFAPDQTINTGQTINNLPVYDNTGQELQPLADIQYQITQVEATGTGEIKLDDNGSYRQVGSPTTITTDKQGTATVSLPDGYYIVTEMANKAQGLTTPQAPVLIKLPAWDAQSGSYLDTLYIYPKSSVVKDDSSNGKDPITNGEAATGNPGTATSSDPASSKESSEQDVLGDVLPNTGDIQTIASILGCLVLGAVLIIILIKRRRQHEDERTT